MAVTEIPWGDGSGDKIYLTYSASTGDQTILVSSDANSGSSARTKDITFLTTVGNISRTLTVSQESGMDLVSITWNDVCVTWNDTAIAYPDTSLKYVTDGLVLRLDGIDKGPDSTAWVDLVDGYSFANNGAVFNSDHIYLNGSSYLEGSATPLFPTTNIGTIEAVYEREADYGTIIMAPAGSNQVALGNIKGYGLLWSAGLNRPKYSDMPSFGSVSISLARALGNGVALTQNGSSYMGSGPASTPAYIGRRHNGHYFTGKIYSIRIYNRQLTEAEVLSNLAVDNERFNLGLTL